MFKNRILISILLPVIIIGLIIAFLSYNFLLPPLVKNITNHKNATLKYAVEMGLDICDERFNNILELRIEDDSEINTAYRREALEEIKSISSKFPGVDMLVVDKNGYVLDSSGLKSLKNLKVVGLKKSASDIIPWEMAGEPVRICYRYFPFWRWHIISMISEKEFSAPVLMVRRIVVIGTFGVLIVVVLSLILIFLWKVNRPLRKIISATESVGKGKLSFVEIHNKDEIGKVGRAFNSMVKNLNEDSLKIKSMMAMLRDSEEQYRILTEYSLTHIAMIQKGKFIYVNKRMQSTLEYEIDEIIGKKALEVVSQKNREMVRDRILALENGEQEADHYECEMETKTGDLLWFETLATLILYKEKSAVLLHAVDITQKKVAESERLEMRKQLERARKMEAIGTLAGGLAHDLNNILGGVVSYPELLLMDLPEESPLVKPLKIIQQSGQKAADIVQDMLTLTRRGVVASEVVNLNEIIKNYLESPEHEKLNLLHPDVKFEIKPDKDLFNIIGSFIHLSKTIMNLVLNAAEAMPKGGCVSIYTSNRYVDTPLKGYEMIKEGEYAVMSISDTGVGIAPEDLNKIFEPFYTRKVMGRSGSGLGMAVVWGTVKDQHGFIDIISAPGKGSTFDLYFPVTREEKAEPIDPIPIDGFKGNETIMVVDDIEEQRDIASKILKTLGYSVVVMSSGENAVGYIKTNKVDLVILDMIMEPGMDGLDTYRQILQVYPDQKAIIATGFSETERVRETQRLGAGSYIKKPYVLRSLGKAVRDELDK